MNSAMARLVLTLSIGISLSYFAQEPDFLNYFNAKQVGNEVLLSFELKSGEICLGINIERRVGQENYQSVGAIDGVCGSPDVPEAYTFRDEFPVLGALNVYRLSLGGLGVTETKEIFLVDLQDRGYTLLPAQNGNPARLYFRNDFSDEVTLYFYDLKGHVLYQSQTTEIFVDLPAHLPKQQIIVFHLVVLSSKKSLKGKLMVG